MLHPALDDVERCLDRFGGARGHQLGEYLVYGLKVGPERLRAAAGVEGEALDSRRTESRPCQRKRATYLLKIRG